MTTLSAIRQRLEERSPLPDLCPKRIWDPVLSKQIQELSPEALTGESPISSLALEAIRSGLLLWNDDLDASHVISQKLDNQLGSYWHGIMHRREGDFSNAKYWFRLVGHHPVYDLVYEQGCQIVPQLREWNSWRADRFVDLVSELTSAGKEHTAEAEAWKQLQKLEFGLLLDYSLKA